MGLLSSWSSTPSGWAGEGELLVWEGWRYKRQKGGNERGIAEIELAHRMLLGRFYMKVWFPLLRGGWFSWEPCSQSWWFPHSLDPKLFHQKGLGSRSISTGFINYTNDLHVRRTVYLEPVYPQNNVKLISPVTNGSLHDYACYSDTSI